MLKINEDLLVDELCMTALELRKNTKSSFINSNYDSYMQLNRSLLLNFGKIIVNTEYCNPYILNNVLTRKDINSMNQFIKYIDDGRDILFDMSCNICDYMDDIDFKTYPFYDVGRRYNEKDFKDLILGYYSTIGNDYYKIAKKYFDEGRIHFGSILEDGDGYFVEIPWLNSGYMFVVFNHLDSPAAAILVHEIGHAIDAERFLFPQKKNILLTPDYLCEIPSTAFEMGFNDYLIDNKIDVDAGRINNNDKLSMLRVGMGVLRDTLPEEEAIIFMDGFAIDENGFEISLRDSMLYGLGVYFSLHLDLIRKSDNKEFLKVLNNIITSRKEASLEDIIGMTGFDFDDFVSGKLIQSKIESETLSLKKRYKY